MDTTVTTPQTPATPIAQPNPQTPNLNSQGNPTNPNYVPPTQTPAAPAQPAETPTEEKVEDINLDNIFVQEQTPVAPKTKEGEEGGELSEEEIELQKKIEDSQAPLKETLRKEQKLRELNEIFNTPEGKLLQKYKSVLEKAIVDPRWGQMKTPNIITAALGMGTLIKIGADIEKAARKQQVPFQPAGSPARPATNATGKPFVGEGAMTDAEFEEFNRANGITI